MRNIFENSYFPLARGVGRQSDSISLYLQCPQTYCFFPVCRRVQWKRPRFACRELTRSAYGDASSEAEHAVPRLAVFAVTFMTIMISLLMPIE